MLRDHRVHANPIALKNDRSCNKNFKVAKKHTGREDGQAVFFAFEE